MILVELQVKVRRDLRINLECAQIVHLGSVLCGL